MSFQIQKSIPSFKSISPVKVAQKLDTRFDPCEGRWIDLIKLSIYLPRSEIFTYTRRKFQLDPKIRAAFPRKVLNTPYFIILSFYSSNLAQVTESNIIILDKGHLIMSHISNRIIGNLNANFQVDQLSFCRMTLNLKCRASWNV